MSTSTTSGSTSTTQVMPGIGSNYLGIGSGSSGTTPANTLNEQDFLTLFTAQLQNQDPTNPMQSYQLASQLAQFTTVEQLTQATSQLNGIEQYSGGINNSQILSLVGKTITAQDNSMSLSSGTLANSLNYALSKPSTVTYTVADSNGNTIYSGNIGAQNAGSYSVPWTGTDSSGSTVSDGSYTVTVTATPSDGSSAAAAVQTTVQGQVSSCNLSASPPTYTLSGVNGAQIPVSNVLGVNSN